MSVAVKIVQQKHISNRSTKACCYVCLARFLQQQNPKNFLLCCTPGGALLCCTSGVVRVEPPLNSDMSLYRPPGSENTIVIAETSGAMISQWANHPCSHGEKKQGQLPLTQLL